MLRGLRYLIFCRIVLFIIQNKKTMGSTVTSTEAYIIITGTYSHQTLKYSKVSGNEKKTNAAKYFNIYYRYYLYYYIIIFYILYISSILYIYLYIYIYIQNTHRENQLCDNQFPTFQVTSNKITSYFYRNILLKSPTK